jgi:hypothetical protein
MTHRMTANGDESERKWKETAMGYFNTIPITVKRN